MEAEAVILLAISSWFLVAAAMLWGMLRIVRRHARDADERQAETLVRLAPPPARRSKPRRHKQPRPAFAPAYRAAHRFAHR